MMTVLLAPDRQTFYEVLGEILVLATFQSPHADLIRSARHSRACSPAGELPLTAHKHAPRCIAEIALADSLARSAMLGRRQL